MLALTSKQLDSAVDDLRTGISSWRLGHFLAWQDIKQRYRRSTLGPIWMTLSFGVQIFTMGFLSAFLFGAALEKSFPYVCAGMLLWALITQTINEGAGLFVASARYITQIKCPLTVFLIQTVWRNIIIAGHNVAIYVACAVFCGRPQSQHGAVAAGVVSRGDLPVVDGFDSSGHLGPLSRRSPAHCQHSRHSFLVDAVDVFSGTTPPKALHRRL